MFFYMNRKIQRKETHEINHAYFYYVQKNKAERQNIFFFIFHPSDLLEYFTIKMH